MDFDSIMRYSNAINPIWSTVLSVEDSGQMLITPVDLGPVLSSLVDFSPMLRNFSWFSLNNTEVIFMAIHTDYDKS
jgi:hypothetical protein